MQQQIVTRPMTSQSFVSGQPRFLDEALAALAARAGTVAAWQAAFSQHGPAAAARVAGTFAIALVCSPTKIYLAVDRFSVQPLCYRQQGDRLLFSDRADTLAHSEIDPQAIFDYLFFHVIPAPRTIYKNVFRLPGGHCAVFENSELTVARYWTPTFEENKQRPFGQLRDEFRNVLQESVASQLDGRTVGCFLSGGTDSSTVAGMLGQVSGTPAATYSIGFDAPGYDEMEYARIAARHFNTRHHEYYVTADDLVSSIPKVAAYYDQPFGNSSAVPAYYCAQMAKADGAAKVLAGDGGDELFGGNSRYAKQRIFNCYSSLPEGLRSTFLEPLLGSGPLAKLPLLRKASSYIQQARVPMPGRLRLYNLIIRLGITNVVTPALRAHFDLDDPVRQQEAVWAQTNTGSFINRMLAFDWRYTLADNDLPKVAGTSALAGVDVGFPLLDTRLVDFSMRLPPDLKVKGLKLRWFFKEALRGFLPDAIITKKKHGFGLPFGIWASQHAALGSLARDSLHGLAARRLVQPQFVKALLNEHLVAHPGYYGEMVWILMILEQWLQAHAPHYEVS
jgi:asparagine synthase (glutamine-hydrolysing)